MRKTLPPRRRSQTATVPFAGEKYHITVGYYADGRPGEVFINRIRDKAAARLGEQLDGICRDAAIMLSLAIQHGVSIDTMLHAVTRNGDGSVSTLIGTLVERIKDESGEGKPDVFA